MLKTGEIATNLGTEIRATWLPVGTSSPLDSVEELRSSLAQEVRASIQGQFLSAAMAGEISKIRAWRVMRGLDQAELAARAGMSQPEVSRAERLGQAKRMKGETLQRIAQALHVRIDDLL